MIFDRFIGILMILVLVMTAVLLLRNLRHKKRIALRVKRLYDSTLYVEMKPFLYACRSITIEQLDVSKNGMKAQCWYRGKLDECSLNMSELDRPNLSDGQQEAVCQVLEKEIPVLAQKRKYAKKVRYLKLPNGDYEFTCRYSMKPWYKHQLSGIQGSDVVM